MDCVLDFQIWIYLHTHKDWWANVYQNDHKNYWRLKPSVLNQLAAANPLFCNYFSRKLLILTIKHIQFKLFVVILIIKTENKIFFFLNILNLSKWKLLQWLLLPPRIKSQCKRLKTKTSGHYSLPQIISTIGQLSYVRENLT